MNAQTIRTHLEKVELISSGTVVSQTSNQPSQLKPPNQPNQLKRGAPQVEQTSSTLSKQNSEIDKAVNQLFLRFSAIYGHIWKSLYKHADFLEYTKREWAKSLKRFDGESIARAVDQCVRLHEYPPTLPQFYQLCKQSIPYVKPIESHVICAAPDVARAHLDGLKQILKIK